MAVKKIGHIVNTFGIKGQLKVSVSSSTPDKRFAVGKEILIKDTNGVEQTYKIKSFFLKNPKIAIIGLEGFDDINQIEWMVDHDILATVRAPKGTFFYDDLVGMKVFDNDNKEIGIVSNVVKMPAGDYLLVDKYYIPFQLDRFIESIDKIKKCIKLTALGTETCK